jgi:predicted nucleic acid-binding protein
MKYLLDTDVLIWILRGEKQIVESVLEITKVKKQAISLISVAEIFKNVFPKEKRPQLNF